MNPHSPAAAHDLLLRQKATRIALSLSGAYGRQDSRAILMLADRLIDTFLMPLTPASNVRIVP